VANSRGGDARHAPGAAVPPAGRFEPFGPRPQRIFALAIGLPAVLVYIVSAVMVIVTLATMASEIDRLESERGVTTMHAVLDSFLNGVSDVAANETAWNEAYLNVVIQPDPAWMDDTWGTTARLGDVYDDVMVTDQDGLVLFGENALGPIRGNIAARYPAARTMLEALDRDIAASGDAAVVAHFAASGQQPAGLAAASIHRSTPGEARVPRHNRRILWVARHITPALLQDFAIRYQTPLAHLVTGIEPQTASVDIVDADGRIAGTVAWTPDNPGDTAFGHALLIASLVLLAVGLALLVGLRLLRRAMLRRAEAIAAAFATAAQASGAPPEAAAAAADAAPAPAIGGIEGVDASDSTLAYQPIFELRTQALAGVEILLRWSRPDGTPLLHEDLAAADAAALLARAAIPALRQATSELAPYIGTVLSLAVGWDQLQNPVFTEKVLATLAATGFPARRLQLCVAVAQLPDPMRFAGAVSGLRRAGIAVALADFTLGPESFGYLRPGVADRICLAPHVVALLDADPVRRALVEATVAAARAAAFAITVPGVTRKEEAAHLLRLGCSEIRGPLLAPPMPVGSLTNLLLAPARPAQQTAG